MTTYTKKTLSDFGVPTKDTHAAHAMPVIALQVGGSVIPVPVNPAWGTTALDCARAYAAGAANRPSDKLTAAAAMFGKKPIAQASIGRLFNGDQKRNVVASLLSLNRVKHEDVKTDIVDLDGQPTGKQGAADRLLGLVSDNAEALAQKINRATLAYHKANSIWYPGCDKASKPAKRKTAKRKLAKRKTQAAKSDAPKTDESTTSDVPSADKTQGAE